MLMDKIGYIIDDKLASVQTESIKTGFQKIFARFQELAEEGSIPELSLRVRILIKNMIDNRASNWEKSRA